MKFKIYQDGKIVDNFQLVGAYLFGPDRTPLRATNGLKFANGMLECEGADLDSAGLSLLWHVKGYGRMMLPTTRLNNREEPYILNLELARARIMQITIKREDWAFFDDSNSLGKMLKDAQALFVKALNKISDPSECSKLADECLEKSVKFSEMFAKKYSETFIALRHKTNAFGRQTLGCQIQPEMVENADYNKRFTDIFGFTTLPLRWSQIEPSKGKYNFDSIDKCFNSLVGKKLFIMAGSLLDFSSEALPDWLKDENPSFARIQEYAYNYISKVVSEYKGRVHFWKIISGMNVNNHFKFNFEQILEMTRTASIASKSADAKSKKIIEIVHPWGEYYALDQQTIPPLVYVDMVLQSGIHFDSFGVKLDFGKDYPGHHVRDMMQISARLDCFAAVPKPLHITSVSVPRKADSNSVGYWREEWSDSAQADWIETIYKIVLGKPFISSVTYANLVDTDYSIIPESGLLQEDLKAGKAYKSIVKLQKFLLKK